MIGSGWGWVGRQVTDIGVDGKVIDLKAPKRSGYTGLHLAVLCQSPMLVKSNFASLPCLSTLAAQPSPSLPAKCGQTVEKTHERFRHKAQRAAIRRFGRFSDVVPALLPYAPRRFVAATLVWPTAFTLHLYVRCQSAVAVSQYHVTVNHSRCCKHSMAASHGALVMLCRCGSTKPTTSTLQSRQSRFYYLQVMYR